jgi:hypothetical protein
MTPIKFHGCNITYGKDQPQYKALPAMINPQGQVITCWELSEEEIQIMLETKKVWINLLTFGKPLQPMLPYVLPSENEPKAKEGEATVISETEVKTADKNEPKTGE